MRVAYEEMAREFARVLEKKGFAAQDAADAADIFAQNSLAGVYSHGLNRFPRIVRYLDKGEIDPRARATCELRAGVLERWDGHRGFGPLNARRAMERACGKQQPLAARRYLWLAGSRQRLHRHLLVQHNAQYARMGRERPQDWKQPVRFGGASLQRRACCAGLRGIPVFLRKDRGLSAAGRAAARAGRLRYKRGTDARPG